MTQKRISGGDFKSPEAVGVRDIVDLIDNPFDLPLLDQFLGSENKKDALLTDASVDSSSFGEFATMTFDGSGKFRSNSQAVIDQIKSLLAMDPNRSLTAPVKVHPCIKKNKQGQTYFSLLG